MAADGEDGPASDASDISGASSSSPSPSATLPALPSPPPPLPVALISLPSPSASVPAGASLSLPPHFYFQHQQRLLSLHLSAATPAFDQQQRPGTTLLPANAEPPSAPPSARPFRDDSWSENATHSLIQAWGDRYLELNRGNLKQNHWKEVADSVNARRVTSSKPPKTDVQCKNRLDTLKKKYKIEKSKLVTDGAPSKWAFFERLDELIGSSSKKPPDELISSSRKQKTPPVVKVNHSLVPVPDKNCTTLTNLDRQFQVTSTAKCMDEDVKQGTPFSFPPQSTVGAPPPPINLHVSSGSIQINHGAHHVNHHASVPIHHHLNELLHMSHHGGTPANHLASAIAVVDHHLCGDAAPVDTVSKSKAGLDVSQSSPVQNQPVDGKRLKSKRDKYRPGEDSHFRDLARAISKLGEVYERVENAKLQQMFELEKQRMEFTKDLEIQRLQIFMQTQVEIAKMKHGRSKPSNAEHQA